MPKSNGEIENAFRGIESLYDQISVKNRAELETASIKPIHDLYPFAQNGICAMIATMGSGKTYNYLKMMAKQEALDDDPFYELIVICSTSARFDKTVETFKKTIRKSKLICVKDSQLLAWLNAYMRRMLKYNAFMKYIQSDLRQTNDVIDKAIAKHRLTKKAKLIEYLAKKLAQYNWKTYPHRCLLILDDFASHPLVRNKESEMSRLLKKLRHFNMNVIICVQTTKSIPLELKRILHDCVLFPGISEEDFNDLMRNGPFGSFDRKQLYAEYSKLTNQHSMFVIHIAAKRVIISNPIETKTKVRKA